MPQTKNAPAGVASGEGIKQVGETSSSVPPAWHEQCEWENAASYALGYADGYAAAERAIADEISRAIGVKPYDRRDVIRWLIRTVGQPAPRRPEPYSSPENGTTLGVAERDVIGRAA
ncbi:hypothetical protein U2F26_03295 [Micromonospora sp. 4G57]|uniref:Uncharacterized protein n=1 Tax=Micromonospora sicca TaxID=2202420 RepID=A0ABU5JCJ9_9ACTN|nr:MULTISPECIES: hypothetical protein [unclassified Micromonospora]MDZ5441757.1 hypothetical protein [Micromonospora sp. 4G57]MDZ5490318.1 hypothetical protein [Micromonospora sp. 4G53]